MPFARPASWPAFHAVLRQRAQATSEDRFVAENFLEDERVSEEREETCRNTGQAHAINDEAAWRDLHADYLRSSIFVNRGVPDTFLTSNAPNLYDGLESRQYVVRLERAEPIARAAAMPVADLVRLAGDALRGEQRADDAVESTLEKSAAGRDRRPVFVSFWGEAMDLFEPNRPTDWPNRLRDRFGLTHLAPVGSRAIPVVLFRYRASHVVTSGVRRSQAGGRFAAPTVLDTSLNPAFCPSPKDAGHGYAVDLSAVEGQLRAELLHSSVAIGVDALFAVGEIDAPQGCPLAEARARHIDLLNAPEENPT